MASSKKSGRTSLKQARLLFSESEQGADMFHATGFRAPDPFVFLESRGKTSILLSDLEIDRGRKEARVDEVVSWSDLDRKVVANTGTKPSSAAIIAAFAKARGGSRPQVPSDFPLGLARELERHG